MHKSALVDIMSLKVSVGVVLDHVLLEIETVSVYFFTHQAFVLVVSNLGLHVFPTLFPMHILQMCSEV